MRAAELSRTIPELLPKLWAFALRLSGDPLDAEDLVQQACIRALESSDQLSTGKSALCWIYAIAYRIWVDGLRTRSWRNRVREDEAAAAETVDSHGAGDPESHALNRQIVDAIGQLPEPQRIVMLLVAAEGLSYREAADVLDVPVGTVMSRLARAREAIGRKFDARTPKLKAAAE